jgi:putative mRNA 3-end processing factor
MKIRFLGGAEMVGKLGMVLENKGANLLFEYGLKLRPKEPPEPPIEAPHVDHAFLTHSHVDHSGMIPWLCSRFDCRVTSTPMTIAVAQILLQDTIKVADSEGYPRPFEPEDIRKAMSSFAPMDYGDVIDVGGLEVELHSAGHVPGATMFELRGDQTTLFTGDMHTYSTRLVYGAHPVKCDNLIIEGTYAGRLHPDRQKEENRLVQKVKEVVERGGKAIIPCFAVGRTQEAMLILKDLKYDMWVDGMGKTVNRIYLDHPEYLRSDKQLKQARNKFSEVRTPAVRDRAKRGQVIITTGGMVDGGPVLSYLDHIKDDPRSAILMTGYQVEGSNGRKLIDGGYLDVPDYGPRGRRAAPEEIVPAPMTRRIKVKCEIQQFDLSAHADHNELLAFIRGCDPEKIVIMHSDNREALAKDLQDDFKVFMPKTGETIEI